jgi:hypothetical protein
MNTQTDKIKQKDKIIKNIIKVKWFQKKKYINKK